MEPQPAAGNSFIKSEPRIEGSASKNDLSQSGGPPKETNDLNEAHQRLKITEEHTVKPKEEADLENNTHSNLDIKLKRTSCSLYPQILTRTRLQEIDPCEQLEFQELLLQFTNSSISSTVNLSLLVSDTNDVFPVEENGAHHICIESSFNRFCDCIKRMISEVLLLLNNIKEIEQNVNADKVEDAQHTNRCEYACHSLLLEKINPEDSSMNKILDATDYAVDHLDEVSLQYLKNIHTRVDPDCKVGVFRTCPVNVDTPFKRFKTTEPTLIIEELEEVLERIKGVLVPSVDKEEAILIAMTASVDFVMTHPFLDGNGRCSRILFVAILKKFAEFPFIIIPSDDICSTEYGGSLTIVRRHKDYTPIYRFLVTCIHRSLEMYRRGLQS